MKRTGLRSMALVAACLTITAALMAGCTSAKSFLGHLRFWGPEQKTATKNMETGDVSTFLSGVRNARGNPDSHYLLAVHYQQQDRHREALEELRKVVIIDPLHARAYNGMGISHDNLGEFDRAREAYGIAMALAPQEPYLYNNLGHSLTLKGDYEAAADILQKGLELNPDNEQMHNNLAAALAGLGDNDRALTELGRTRKPAQAALTLARIHKQQGRLEDAQTSFAAAISLDPSLEKQIPDGDRFVTRITRSVREVGQARSRSGKKDHALVKILDPSAKVTGRLAAGTDSLRTPDPKTFTLKIPKLEPDFLVNKAAAVTGGKDPASSPRRRADEPCPEAVRGLFAVQYIKDTTTLDRLMGGQQWF